MKDGIQKYVKGELAEADLKSILKENNINPDLNSVRIYYKFFNKFKTLLNLSQVKREIRSASIAGQNQNKNLMLTIMKNKDR